MLAADALARHHGMRTTLACKIAETSIGSAALAQVAALLPDVDWGVSVTHATLAEDVVAVPLSLEGGLLQVPQGEGIGVLPDPAALRRLSAG
jgi:L-alanine-DL-glutamate epimerase-like enolase superfamily enzyme